VFLTYITKKITGLLQPQQQNSYKNKGHSDDNRVCFSSALPAIGRTLCLPRSHNVQQIHF